MLILKARGRRVTFRHRFQSMLEREVRLWGVVVLILKASKMVLSLVLLTIDFEWIVQLL